MILSLTTIYIKAPGVGLEPFYHARGVISYWQNHWLTKGSLSYFMLLVSKFYIIL